MTKVRAPLTFSLAITTAVGLIGWDQAAKITRRSKRAVRYWSESDKASMPTLDQAIGLQILQAGRHHLGRCSGLSLNLVEPVAANEEFPQHQDGPAIPDNRLCSGDRTQGIQFGVVLHRPVTLFFIAT